MGTRNNVNKPPPRNLQREQRIRKRSFKRSAAAPSRPQDLVIHGRQPSKKKQKQLARQLRLKRNELRSEDVEMADARPNSKTKKTRTTTNEPQSMSIDLAATGHETISDEPSAIWASVNAQSTQDDAVTSGLASAFENVNFSGS